MKHGSIGSTLGVWVGDNLQFGAKLIPQFKMASRHLQLYTKFYVKFHSNGTPNLVNE